MFWRRKQRRPRLRYDAPKNRKPVANRPNDEPIKRISQDRFNARDYARTLARQILKIDTPATVGIFGTWGSGKTSLMNLIEAYLKPWSPRKSAWSRFAIRMRFALRSLRRGRRPQGARPVYRNLPARPQWQVHTIWINAWQLTNQEDVWHAFLQSLINAVREGVPLRKKINYWQTFKNFWVFGFVALAVLASSKLTSLSPLQKAPWQALAMGVSLTWAIYKEFKARPSFSFDVKVMLKTGSYRSRINELDRLRKQFSGFVTDLVRNDLPRRVDPRSLVEGTRRLVVFVDDLDRCSPKALPEVLEAIKLFAATERCVYVLGMDRPIVCEAIKQAYRFQHDHEPLRYLDKIVQLPFQLPLLSEDSAKAFLAGLPAAEIFVKGMEANPRALKRAAQSYSTVQELAVRLLDRLEIEALKPELLAKWLTIQMRFPDLAEDIARDTGCLWRLESDAVRKQRDPAYSPGPTPKSVTDLSPSDRQDLETILAMGDCRFGHRSNREATKSYIFMGNASGGGGLIRGGSRARRLLLSGRLDEQQQFANQLAVWREVKPRSDESEPAGRAAYQQWLRHAPPETASPDQIKSACAALESAYEEETGTLAVPPRDHVLGTGASQLAAAEQDKLEPQLVELERQQVDIHVPAFRIGRFPVTNEEYVAWVETIRAKGPRSEPYGIVEYEAYVEPFFRQWWDCPQDGQRNASIRVTEQDKLRGTIQLEILDAEVFSVQFTPAGSNHPDTADLVIPNIDGRNGVLERPDLFLLVTIRKPEYHDYGYHAYVRAWNKDREMKIDPDPKRIWNFSRGFERHPATRITWEDAAAYCMWMKKYEGGRPFRLLKEPEWETAATEQYHATERKNIYPWGDAWDQEKANTLESGRNATTAVDYFSPEGDSPFGVADMGGNVAEWCADASGKLSWVPSGLLWDDARFRGGSEGAPAFERAVRGGSFRNSRVYARTSCRQHYDPTQPSETIGFRVAIATEFEITCVRSSVSESRASVASAGTSPQP